MLLQDRNEMPASLYKGKRYLLVESNKDEMN